MLESDLANLVGKMTRQAQAMGYETAAEAIKGMEKLQSKAVEMTCLNLEAALDDLGHYRLGDPSIHDREFEEEVG